MSGEGSSPAAVNSRTEITYKPKDIKDREFRLKHLKRITEINLNLVRDSRSDLYLTLFLCVFAIIIGIIFLTLRGLQYCTMNQLEEYGNLNNVLKEALFIYDYILHWGYIFFGVESYVILVIHQMKHFISIYLNHLFLANPAMIQIKY
ncbi:hypothetical protein GLOIN_2v1728789 [Rhizophagus clarus]|uniref:Uncharacterized protein n=1 Tax=Rhizophagus clarus TaxID=94130 RepID=A0A8H3MBT0_9GLOM|nr:hypothetical protein GLOIN_2v1728789 [Rhizophagus clarus]